MTACLRSMKYQSASRKRLVRLFTHWATGAASNGQTVPATPGVLHAGAVWFCQVASPPSERRWPKAGKGRRPGKRCGCWIYRRRKPSALGIICMACKAARHWPMHSRNRQRHTTGTLPAPGADSKRGTSERIRARGVGTTRLYTIFSNKLGADDGA